MLVAWDTYEVPTYRHEKFPAYQSGRTFDEALIEQLPLLAEFVTACGFQNAKAPGFEADDFLASAAAAEERRGGTVLIASGIAIRFSSLQTGQPSSIRFVPAKRPASIPPRFAAVTGSNPSKFRTLSPCGEILPIASQAHRAWGQLAQQLCSDDMEA